MMAMGYPAAGGMIEKITRNHVDEVERFIAEKHNNQVRLQLCLLLYLPPEIFLGTMKLGNGSYRALAGAGNAASDRKSS